MRNRKSFKQLKRTQSHRSSLMINLAKSLIQYKRIITTKAKAKALRPFVEPILSRTKQDSMHSRRVVFSKLQDKIVTRILFEEVANKIATRPGGYTRIIKLGHRLGDNSEKCLVELVDYNTLYTTKTSTNTQKHRKTRRSKKKNINTTEKNNIQNKEINSKE